MEKPTTYDELQAALEGDRYRILECLAVHDELSSGEIRDRAVIPEGSKYYQLSILESWELIEPSDTEYIDEYDTGIPAIIYTLTDEGHTLVDERSIRR